MAIPVTAVFDIGRTNKKFFLFDEALNEVKEEYIKFPLIEDEDGYPCEDLEALTNWIKGTVSTICKSTEYQLKGLNFSTYGATLVHLNEKGEPIAPLYNYLNPYPKTLSEAFFSHHEEERNNVETASPNLGMLNSGLQLYWLKKHKPHLFKRIRYTLHFPQYLSYLFTGEMVCEPTSIGCHTRLWNYSEGTYHNWVVQEGIDQLFPEFVPSTHTFTCDIEGHQVKVGVGIHDSSSALASYLMRTEDPFLLISTGTWSITLNPFTKESLTKAELERDCLNYLTIDGKPVKACRFFLGYGLDHQLSRLNAIFHKESKYYKTVSPDVSLINKLITEETVNTYYPKGSRIDDLFIENHWEPESCKDFEEAYHKVMWRLVMMQAATLQLAKGTSSIKKVFIDGGFVHNKVFIYMLEHFLKDFSLKFSDFPLGSAYGAALVMQGKNSHYATNIKA